MLNLNKKLSKVDRGYSRSSGRRFSKTFWKRLLIVLIILFLVVYLPARGVYSSLRALSANAKAMQAATKTENLDNIKQEMKNTRASVRSLNGSLNWFFYFGFVPYFGGFYSDAKHFVTAADYELQAAESVTDTLEPYKAELGLNGTPVPGQDKVAQMVKILDKVLPTVDKVEPNLRKARTEVEKIDVNKYPEKFGTRQLRSKIDQAKNLIVGAHVAVTEAKPALMIAPSALGQPDAKNYLLLFQNDKELRATGGFLTAYAFLKLDKGHLSTTQSDDIYRLDEKLLNVCISKICPLTPPAPLVKYLPEADGKPRTAWSMRDSNLSPDLPTSARDFERMYKMLGDSQPYDGIITIDTQVVEEIIAVTGPIDVLGTTYSAETDKRCNCPNVVYELEKYAEIAAKGESDRKAILGTLMQQILARVLGSGTDTMLGFVNVGVKLANHKHVMFYMNDQKAQSALSQLGWTGEIKQTSGDYLHINDSNFAGGKSNLYVDEKVTLEIDTSGKGSVKHKLSIDYKNPQAFNTWLNGINRDYLRIYVPQGSKLTNSKGSDVAVNTFEELGKTVFDAFIQIRPQNSRTITFEYTSPVQYDGKYPLLIQKQPGAKDHQYSVKVNGKTQNFPLISDKSLSF
jgi:hypothetical protein